MIKYTFKINVDRNGPVVGHLFYDVYASSEMDALGIVSAFAHTLNASHTAYRFCVSNFE